MSIKEALWDEMAAEVKADNIQKGWYDEPVAFSTAMALLASEACEALQAWREWGFTDRTSSDLPEYMDAHGPKVSALSLPIS